MRKKSVTLYFNASDIFSFELAKRPIINEITNSFAIFWALVGSLGIALGFVFLKK